MVERIAKESTTSSPSRQFPSMAPSELPWRIVLMLTGFAALGHLNRVGISVAGSEVFIPELGISETKMGAVYTTFLITYSIGMLPGGWLIDRIGASRAMTLFGLTMGFFVAATGTLGWLTSSAVGLWMSLLVIRGLAGICSTPLHPGAAHIIHDILPIRRRASANGIVTSGALVGIACSYPIYGWLMDKFGWPFAFIVGGVTLTAYGLLWSAFTSSRIPRCTADQSRAIKTTATFFWPLLRQRDLWFLALSYAAYGYFQYLFFYWMSYYFKEILHVPDVEARWASFWIMLSQGAGMVVGGMCTDFVCRSMGTIHGRRLIVITGMGLGGLFGLLGVNVTDQNSVAISLAISMAALGLCEGVFWTTATDIGRSSPGFSAAFMNTGGNVGGLFSPVLTPLMAQSLGWPTAIIIACVIACLGGLVWFLFKPTLETPSRN